MLSAPADMAGPDGDSLALHLLGAPCWQRWRAGRPLGPAVKLGIKDAALLAILALEGAQPRDRVAALLWPGAASVQAASLNLRQRIFRLRQATGHPLVQAGAVLCLLPDGLECDLWATGWEARQTWPEGELLADAALPAPHEPLADWLTQARAHVAQVWQDSLWQAARRAEAVGHHESTVRLCRQWLRHHPCSEEQWRRLVTAHYLAGDLDTAAQAAQEAQQALVEEMGMAPGPETVELIHTVLYARRERQHTAQEPTRPCPVCPGHKTTTPKETGDADWFSGQLQALSPQAMLLARALALMDAHAPLAATVPTAARLLNVSALELAAPWQELEAAGLLQAPPQRGARIAGTALCSHLLAGIPTTLVDHLRGQLA
jgi:DNA-binding SARP family transcriptional activator